jgi:hypothetical protein
VRDQCDPITNVLPCHNRDLLARRLTLVEHVGEFGGAFSARMKLCLLLDRHPALAVRVLVEDWSLERLVREVY